MVGVLVAALFALVGLGLWIGHRCHRWQLFLPALAAGLAVPFVDPARAGGTGMFVQGIVCLFEARSFATSSWWEMKQAGLLPGRRSRDAVRQLPTDTRMAGIVFVGIYLAFVGLILALYGIQL